MIDRREQILAQLLVVAQGLDGMPPNAVARNRTDVAGAVRPAIIIHDADENYSERKASFDTRPPRGTALKIMDMTPVITIVVLGNAGGADLGTLLNLYRLRLLAAVLNDETLKSLIGQSGEIDYQGCMLHPVPTGSAEGRMEVNITFSYLFRAADLTD